MRAKGRILACFHTYRGTVLPLVVGLLKTLAACLGISDKVSPVPHPAFQKNSLLPPYLLLTTRSGSGTYASKCPHNQSPITNHPPNTLPRCHPGNTGRAQTTSPEQKSMAVLFTWKALAREARQGQSSPRIAWQRAWTAWGPATSSCAS